MSGCKFGVMRCTLFKSTNKTMSTQTIPPAVRQQRAIAWLRIKLLPGLLLRLLARAAGWTFVFFATCGILATLIYGGMSMLGYGPGLGKGPLMYLGEAKYDCTTWQGVSVMLLFNVLLLGLGRGFIRKSGASHKNSSKAS